MKNTDILRGGYAAFSAGDIAGALAVFQDDIEWVETAGYIYAGTYTGHDAVVTNIMAPLGTEWDSFLVEPDTFIGEGDQVATRGWLSGTYKATGVAFRARFVHWWTMTDGRASRMESVIDTGKMAEAISPPAG